MLGILYSIAAGAAMSLQGVFNTALSKGAGLYEANSFVQGTAFFLSLIVCRIFGDGSYNQLFSVPKLYLTGGIIGVIITVTVMLAIKNQGATVAISVILIAQLVTAALINAFGLFGEPKTAFGLSKYIGLALMIAGVLIFKREI